MPVAETQYIRLPGGNGTCSNAINLGVLQRPVGLSLEQIPDLLQVTPSGLGVDFGHLLLDEDIAALDVAKVWRGKEGCQRR